MSGRSEPEQGSGECELLFIRRIWGNVPHSVFMRWSGGRVGLRRRIKAPFSQGARVQIPSGLFWKKSGRGAGVEDGDVCAQASHGQLRRRRRESNTLPFRSPWSDRAGRRRRHAPPTSRSRGRLRGSVSLATHPPARLRDLRSEIHSRLSRIGGCFPWSGSLKARVWVSTCTS